MDGGGGGGGEEQEGGGAHRYDLMGIMYIEVLLGIR